MSPTIELITIDYSHRKSTHDKLWLSNNHQLLWTTHHNNRPEPALTPFHQPIYLSAYQIDKRKWKIIVDSSRTHDQSLCVVILEECGISTSLSCSSCYSQCVSLVLSVWNVINVILLLETTNAIWTETSPRCLSKAVQPKLRLGSPKSDVLVLMLQVGSYIVMQFISDNLVHIDHKSILILLFFLVLEDGEEHWYVYRGCMPKASCELFKLNNLMKNRNFTTNECYICDTDLCNTKRRRLKLNVI